MSTTKHNDVSLTIHMVVNRAVMLVVASAWLFLRLRRLAQGDLTWPLLGIAMHLGLDGLTHGWPEVRRVLGELTTLPSDDSGLRSLCRQLSRLNQYITRYSGVVLFTFLALPVLGARYMIEDWFYCGATPAMGLLWPALIVLLCVGFCSTAHLTSHRYFTHRSFRACRPVQALLGVSAAATGQGGAFEWASAHVRHHRECEGDRDPHSPARHGLLEAHLLWLTRSEYFLVDPARLPSCARDCLELWLCEAFSIDISALLMQLLAGGLQMAVLPDCADPDVVVLLAYSLSLHAVSLTNSWCHERNGPDGACAAQDVPWVALLNGGEGWHRRHHDDPSCANHGLTSGGLDVTYLMICALERLRIVSDVRHGSTTKVEKKL